MTPSTSTHPSACSELSDSPSTITASRTTTTPLAEATGLTMAIAHGYPKLERLMGVPDSALTGDLDTPTGSTVRCVRAEPSA